MKTEFLSGEEIPEVENAEMAFGACDLSTFPPYEEIPKEFKNGHTKWNKLFNDWFFEGLSSLDLTPKEGIDKEKVMRYIRAHMKTRRSKREHKEAGIAYCLSLKKESIICLKLKESLINFVCYVPITTE